MTLPYFPMYPRDFEADTSHLSLEEDGAYNRLLRLCWMTAGCSLPDDDAWIMRRMRVDQETFDRVVRVVLDEFFVRKSGRVSNARLAKENTSSKEKHEKRKNAGSKGGKSKALKTKENASSNARAMLKQPEPEPEPYSSISSDEDIVISHPSELSQAIDVFNEAAVSVGWQKCQTVTAARSKSLKARLREVGGIDGWRLAIRKAVSSDFLAGRNGKWHGFSFDWIIKQSNFTKLMEGNYGNRSINNGCNQPRRNGDGSATVEAFAEVARRRAQGCS